MASTTFKSLMRQVHSSRIKFVYDALSEIRKKYMKDVPVLIKAGLVQRILEIVRIRDSLEEQYRSKVIVMSMSILGNLCMEDVTRKEILKQKGISCIVELYEEWDCVELLTRVCRCLSNMLLDPNSWKLVCCISVMEKTVKLLKDAENEDDKLTYIRAIRLFGQTDSSVQKLVVQNAVSGVLKNINCDNPKLTESAFRCIHSLSSHRCCTEFASQVITSGKLSALLELVKNKDIKTFQLIIRLCEHHRFRAEFGNTGGIDILLDIVSTENEYTDKWIIDSLSILCLCCKEVVNRVKLREKSILPILLQSLSEDRYSSLHPRIVSAIVCFLYDDTSFELLLERSLVPILIKRLRNFFDTTWEPENSKPETKENIEAKAESGTLVSKELIKLDASNPNDDVCSEGIQKDTAGSTKEIKKGEVTDDKLEAEVKLEEASTITECKPTSSSTKPVYSIHSPTYQSSSTWNYDDDENMTCISRFTPPPYIDGNNGSNYSPISNSSYYSPSEGSPGYSLSSPETSPNGRCNESRSQQLGQPNIPKDSSVVCQLYKSVTSPQYGNSSPTSYYKQDCGSMARGNCSPGWKSPSPSGLIESPEDPITLTYSPVNSDSEPELRSEQNDLSEESKSRECQVDGEITEPSGRYSYVENVNEKNSLNEKTAMGEDCDKTISFSPISETIDARPEMDFSEVFLELDKWECSMKRKRRLTDGANRLTEFNILILLSRVSQMTDPTMHLVTKEVMNCLLDYMRMMNSPLARCPRLLSRLFRNPLCFQTVLSLHIPVLIYEKILWIENLGSVVHHFKDKQRKANTMSDRFSDRSIQQASKRRKTSDDHTFSYKGLDHKQEEDFCEAGSCAMAILEDLSGVVDSYYGRGMVEKLVYSGTDEEKTDICISLLYITWSLASRQYLYNQGYILDTITEVLSPHGDLNSQHFISTVNGLRLLFQVMNTKTKYQHSTMSVATTRYGNQTNSYTSCKAELPVAATEKTNSVLDNISELVNNDGIDNCVTNCCVLQASQLDIVFLVDGQKIFANRSKLCLKSEIFTAMLAGHYSEANLSEIPVIDCPKVAFEIVIHHLHGCTPSTCEIINDLYTKKVTVESALLCIALLNEAHKYMLQDLYSQAIRCLFSRFIIPESSFSVYKHAVLHRDDKLMKASVSCVFYDSTCCAGAIQTCKEFLSSCYSALFLNTLTDILLE